MPRRKRGNGRSNGRNGKPKRLYVLGFNKDGNDTRLAPLNSNKPQGNVNNINPAKGKWSTFRINGESQGVPDEVVHEIGRSDPEAFENLSGVIGIYNLTRVDHVKRMHGDIKRAIVLLN